MAVYNEFPNTGLLDGIVDYYACEEASGNRLTQTNTNNYLAPSNTVAQQIPGKHNDGVQVTGSTTNGNQGKLVSHLSYNLNDDFSISFWIDVQQPGSQLSWNAVTFNNQIALQTIQNIANGLSYNVIYNGTNYGASAGTFNTWQHIVITSSSSAIKFYLNGSLALNQSVTRPTFGSLALTLQGCNQATNTTEFDEVGIWQRVLDSTEVSTLYNSGSGDFWSFGLTYNPALGGGTVSGSARLFGATTVTGSGGVKISGTSIPFHSYTQSAGGTVLIGGKAVVKESSHNVASGGVLISGSASVSSFIPGRGGVVMSGSASAPVKFKPSIGGSVLIGGHAGVTFPLIGSGTVYVSGVAILQATMTIHTGGIIRIGGQSNQFYLYRGSGGVKLSGTAQPGYKFTVKASGGLLIGQGQYSNGYTYRLKITQPAGTVSTTLADFPFGLGTRLIPLTLPKSHVVRQSFLFTDLGGKKLPSEVVNYNASTGALHAFVKDTIGMGETDIYLYYA